MNDVERDRRQQQQGDGSRAHHQDWHGTARRVDPYHGRDPGKRRAHPVGQQRKTQLDRWQPGPDPYPALLAEPAQGRRPLGLGEAGQQVHDGTSATAFGLPV